MIYALLHVMESDLGFLFVIYLIISAILMWHCRGGDPNFKWVIPTYIVNLIIAVILLYDLP